MLVLTLAVGACTSEGGTPAPAAVQPEDAATATAAPAATETPAEPAQAEIPATEAPVATDTAAEPAATEPAADEAAPSTGYATDLSGVRVRVEPVIEGLAAPVWLTHAGDGSGRLFVLEKTGTIRIVRDGQLGETPFLDIRDRVGSSASEQGLLGLAFAPDYSESGHFFVNYTDKSGNTVVSRFQVSGEPDVARPGQWSSRCSASTSPRRTATVAGCSSGPDGHLWIGTGDGETANRFGNRQNPATLLGKMLRLDVTGDPAQPYLIPADNPWMGADWKGQDVAGEIVGAGVAQPVALRLRPGDRRPVDCRCGAEYLRGSTSSGPRSPQAPQVV